MIIFQEFYDFFVVVVKSVREYLKNKYAVHFTAEIEAVFRYENGSCC